MKDVFNKLSIFFTFIWMHLNWDVQFHFTPFGTKLSFTGPRFRRRRHRKIFEYPVELCNFVDRKMPETVSYYKKIMDSMRFFDEIGKRRKGATPAPKVDIKPSDKIEMINTGWQHLN